MPLYGIPKKGVLDSHLAIVKIQFPIILPIVTNDQSISSSSLTTLNGKFPIDVDEYNLSRIAEATVVVEWESAGSGDIDLYDETNSTKVTDVATPTGATSYTVTEVDITNWFTGLTSDVTVVIQVAGDGTNNVTVHKAYIKLVYKIG